MQPENVTCPTRAALQDVNNSIARGFLTWQAFPHNAEPELLGPRAAQLAIDVTHDLDRMFGVGTKTVMSQRDVPGMTRGVLPVLRQAGVRAISVGSNGGSTPPDVPRVFMWRDNVTDTDMLTLYLTGGRCVCPFSDIVLCFIRILELITCWQAGTVD